LKAPSAQGENWQVAGTFTALCGVDDVAYTTGVAAWFSRAKINYVKLLTSLRIT
jgi:hypothetical protein